MKKGDEIAARIEKVLSVLMENPEITVNELALLLDITRKQAESALKKLKESGKIKRDGSARNGKWIIIE